MTRSWTHGSLAGALVGALATGCGNECDPPSHIDGFYPMFSEVDTSTMVGDDRDIYPLEAVFITGWSTWDLEWVPARRTFDVLVDDQPASARYVPDPDDCNDFQLEVDGNYVTEEGTRHTFTWLGALRNLGVHLEGGFTYTDGWGYGPDAQEGSVTVQGTTYGTRRD